MSNCALYRCAVAGLLLFGPQIVAQAQTISTTNPGTAVTTGIVGVTSTQTARLNVLNLQPVVPGVTAVLCPATLEFYDDAGTQLKQVAVTNISPATATALVFKPVVPSTATRAQIRAVVFTPADTVTGPIFMQVRPGCNVMASLEIIDDATGATHTVVTDLRAMPYFTVFPMTAAH